MNKNNTKFDTSEIRYIKNHIADVNERRKAIMRTGIYRSYYSELRNGRKLKIKLTNIKTNEEFIFDNYRSCITYLDNNTTSKSKNKRQKICDCLYGRRKSYLGYTFQLIQTDEPTKENNNE